MVKLYCSSHELRLTQGHSEGVFFVGCFFHLTLNLV